MTSMSEQTVPPEHPPRGGRTPEALDRLRAWWLRMRIVSAVKATARRGGRFSSGRELLVGKSVGSATGEDAVRRIGPGQWGLQPSVLALQVPGCSGRCNCPTNSRL